MGWTAAAILGSSLLGGMASRGAANTQAQAAQTAADAQVEAARIAAQSAQRIADQQIGFAQGVYDDSTANFAPFLDAGTNALAAYNYEMGLGDAPTFGGTAPEIETIYGNQNALAGGMFGGGFSSPAMDRLPDNIRQQIMERGRGRFGQQQPQGYRVGDQTFSTMEEAQAYANANRTGGFQYQGIEMSPGARFALEQGVGEVDASAAHRGSLQSGATLAGLERLRFGMAAQDRENQLNRLGGMVDMGQGSAGMQATAGNAFAGQANAALGQLGAGLQQSAYATGNAQAQGAIGAGNALAAGQTGFADNIMGGVNNLLGYQMMNNMINQPGQPLSAIPWLGG